MTPANRGTDLADNDAFWSYLTSGRFYWGVLKSKDWFFSKKIIFIINETWNNYYLDTRVM